MGDDIYAGIFAASGAVAAVLLAQSAMPELTDLVNRAVQCQDVKDVEDVAIFLLPVISYTGAVIIVAGAIKYYITGK